ncbi:unnamed protein product [Gadus morhua 'NCC']
MQSNKSDLCTLAPRFPDTPRSRRSCIFDEDTTVGGLGGAAGASSTPRPPPGLAVAAQPITRLIWKDSRARRCQLLPPPWQREGKVAGHLASPCWDATPLCTGGLQGHRTAEGCVSLCLC